MAIDLELYEIDEVELARKEFARELKVADSPYQIGWPVRAKRRAVRQGLGRLASMQWVS